MYTTTTSTTTTASLSAPYCFAMHHLASVVPQTPLQIGTSWHMHNTATHVLYCSWPRSRRRSNHKWWVSAAERDSKYEVDQEKARQALTELDQQLESLSTKQVNPPKIKASSLINLKEQMKEEPPEITGSFLGYTAFVLFLFSIFYNILFITVIQPSIDGPEEIVAVNVTISEAVNETQP